MARRSTTFAAMRKPKDPQRSRAEILDAASEEFAARGLEGARVDAVARRTRTTRAMIYYYFRSKEGLYLAVLENAYRGIREAEQTLDLAHLSPEVAMQHLVAFTFDYYQSHPEFVALVIAENQSGAKYIRKMQRMRRLNASIIDTIDDVLDRGRREGVFRAGFDAVELHMTIAALGWFQVANRHTFGYLFRRDLAAAKAIERNRALITDVVLRFVGSDACRKQPAARAEQRDKRLHTIAAPEAAAETVRG
jgi:AcrR family transcriptional regulator